MTLGRIISRSALVVTLFMTTRVSSGLAQSLRPDDRFVFGITVGMDLSAPTRRAPYLHIYTVRELSCLLPLKVTTTADARLLTLTIHGIDREATLCSSAVGPAEGAARLIPQHGWQTILVKWQQETDTLSAFLSDTLLLLNHQSGAVTTVVGGSLHLPPPRTVAVYCSLPYVGTAVDTAQSWVCTDFADSLRAYPGVTEIAARTGDGYWFRRAGIQEWGSPRMFTYRRWEDFAGFYRLLRDFSQLRMALGAPNALLTLRNSLGQAVQSYRCGPDRPLCEPLPEP
jgi:hypothetical protein